MGGVQRGVFAHPYFAELQSQGWLNSLRTWQQIDICARASTEMIDSLWTCVEFRDEFSNIPSNILRRRAVCSMDITFQDVRAVMMNENSRT